MIAKRIQLADEVAEALLAKVAALEAAGNELAVSAVHVPTCALISPAKPYGPCDCGLTAALAAWREAMEG